MKACAVSKTFGERRLAHHLLAGLELLLGVMTPKTMPTVTATVLATIGNRAEPYVESLFDPDTCAKSALQLQWQLQWRGLRFGVWDFGCMGEVWSSVNDGPPRVFQQPVSVTIP